MRLPLVPLLVLCLTLSGCVAQGGSTTAPDRPTPEPVRVTERIDLTRGLALTEWRVEVAPGYTDGHVLARVESTAGAPQYASPGFCFRFEGVQDDGSRYGTGGGGGCDGGGSYSSGSSRGLVLLEGEDFGSGWYRFSFEAKPSAAVLVLEMVARY